MAQHTVSRAELEARDFRTAVEKVCKDRFGRWRPNAIQWMIAEVRTKTGACRELKVAAFFQLQELTKAALGFSKTYPFDRRTNTFLRLVLVELAEAEPLFQNAIRSNKINAEERQLIARVGYSFADLTKQFPS